MDTGGHKTVGVGAGEPGRQAGSAAWSPNAGEARYVWLARELRNLAKGADQYQSLPSERNLARCYGVSRDTVRKAVKLMREHGLVYSERARGTFAAPDAVRRVSGMLHGFSEDAISCGAVPGQTVLFVGRVTPPPVVAAALDIVPGTQVTRLLRLRRYDGKPVGVQDTYLHLPPGLDLSAATLADGGSVYGWLKQAGIAPVEAIDVLSATAATAEDAEVLGLETGTPLLCSTRTAFSERRRPFEYCEMRYVPGYRYRNRVSYPKTTE